MKKVPVKERDADPSVNLEKSIVSKARIDISAGIGAYLVFTAIISLSSLIFIFVYHRRARSSNTMDTAGVVDLQHRTIK